MSVRTNAAAGELRASARSCVTCAKAKAKCVRLAQSERCERCERLSKECHTRETIQRRRKPVKITRSAQLEKLENKLENLVNALSTQQIAPKLPEGGQPSPPISQSTSDNGVAQDMLQRSCGVGNGISQPANFTQNDLRPTNYSSAAQEAQDLLERYRRLLAAFMPFVIIPDGMDAVELLDSRPLLFHAVATVSSFDNLPRQQSMAKAMMRNISESMLINGEKSLDALQGILVFVAWYHPYIFWGQQITNLLHLAMALTVDLGIDRLPSACDKHRLETAATKGMRESPQQVRSVSNEERRAVLGTFYLTSMLSSAFRKIDAMKYTKWLEDCVLALEQTREYESDAMLVNMVRLQHLMEDMHITEAPGVPKSMYIKPFKSDMERVRASASYNSENLILRLQYTIAEVTLWELSFVDIPDNKAKSESIRPRLQDMYRCVQACAAFSEEYLPLPTSVYLTLPFSVFAQWAYCFMAIIKLATLDADGWDFRVFKEQLDLFPLIEAAARRFEEVSKMDVDGIKVNNDSFARWAVKMRYLGQLLEVRLAEKDTTAPGAADAAAGAQGGLDATGVASNQQQATPPDDIMSGDFFNYLDENFWDSFTGELDFGDLIT